MRLRRAPASSHRCGSVRRPWVHSAGEKKCMALRRSLRSLCVSLAVLMTSLAGACVCRTWVIRHGVWSFPNMPVPF